MWEMYLSDRFNLFVCTVTVSSYLVLLYTLVLIFKTAQKSYTQIKEELLNTVFPSRVHCNTDLH